MPKNGKRNKNGLRNHLICKGFVFGASVVLFVATMASFGVVVAGADEGGELLASIKGVYTESFVSLSPNWEKVAFSRYAPYGKEEEIPLALWIIDLDSSNEKQLTTPHTLSMPLCWSPNGKKIFYLCGEGIRVVNLEDGDMQIVKSSLLLNPLNFGNLLGLSLSPDGSKIAYYGEYEGKSGLYIVNTDGSDNNLITDGIPLSWTPKGEKIIFTKIKGNGIFEIWEVNLDSGILKNLSMSSGWPVVSPDGSEIAFSYHGIWIMNLDGSNLKQLTQVESDCISSWSPDSKRIAFVSTEEGIGKGVWVMTADGGSQKKITERVVGEPIGLTLQINYESFTFPNARPINKLVWSKDGSKIAYAIQSPYGTGTTDIYTIGVGKPSPVKPPAGETPTEKQQGIPGFEAVFAIAGVLAVAYILRRRG